MSWINDVFDSAGNNKDPFVKFLFRLTLLVVFLLICFISFFIITGKKFIWSDKGYAIVDPALSFQMAKKTDSLPARDKNEMPKDTSRQSKPIQKRDSLTQAGKKPIQPEAMSSAPTEKPGGLAIDEPVGNADLKVPTTESFSPGGLTKNDKINLDKILNKLIDNRSSSALMVLIYYNRGDVSSIMCGNQLRIYLSSEGYYVFSCDYDLNTNEEGISITYHPASGSIKGVLAYS
jgi:hypothetical protein